MTSAWSFAGSTSGAFAFRVLGAFGVVGTAWGAAAGGQIGCIDTVGAGDGFAAGVISALLEGLPVRDAVRRGAWIGARAVQVPGDTEGLPTLTELARAGL